jgi:hypothetical protein
MWFKVNPILITYFRDVIPLSHWYVRITNNWWDLLLCLSGAHELSLSHAQVVIFRLIKQKEQRAYKVTHSSTQ